MLRWNRGKKEDDAPVGAAAAPSAPVQAPAGPRAVSRQDGPVEAPQSLPNLLLSEGKVTDAQLQAALRKQAETGAFIGEILIEDGVLDEQSLISFLAKHCKIPHLSLLDYLIDKDVVGLIPQEVCLKHRLLPIDKLGKNLTIAMVNPLDASALEQVRACCPELRLKPILCAINHFEIVTRRLFASDTGNGPHELSASQLGLSLPKSAKPGKPVVAAAPPVSAPTPEPAVVPTPEPEAVKPDTLFGQTRLPEPELPPLEPAPVSAPTVAVAVEEEIPEAEEIAAVAPLSPPAPAPREEEEVLHGVFHAAPEASAPPAEVMEDSGLGESSAMLMREMANVMMDSMRDTYAVLARRMELFRGVPPEEVAKIFARGITEEFEEGQPIMEKGTPGDRMYVLLGGEVLIHDGEMELARLGRGDMFGEMALLSNEPRSASARALTTTSVLALSQETIRTGLPPHVSMQVLVNIVVTLSARLRKANEAKA